MAGFRRDVATGALSFIDLERDGVGGLDGLWGARCVVISPDGRHAYATGYHDDAVVIFSRSPATGTLNFSGRAKDDEGGVNGLDGATYLALSPDGATVYVAGHNDNTVVVFRRNAVNGALTFVEMVQDGVDGVDGLWGARGVTVSPDGRHVYATGYFDRAVAVFGQAVFHHAVECLQFAPQRDNLPPHRADWVIRVYQAGEIRRDIHAKPGFSRQAADFFGSQFNQLAEVV